MTTNYISAAVRTVIAVAGLGVGIAGVIAGGPAALMTFTVQSNVLLAASFGWTALTLITDRRTPPEWLAGSTVFYVVITGVVYNFVLSPAAVAEEVPEEVAETAQAVFGLSGSDIAHTAVPVLALLVWIVFAEHRRIPWRYSRGWLVYLLVYLTAVFVLIGAVDAFEAPYPFLDVVEVGIWGVVWRMAIFLVAFAGLAAGLIGLDRWLPARTILSERDRHDPGPL